MRTTPTLRRIAAVHDLSGFGRTSLMTVIPILSTMGFNVCPLPTAVLSNHSQYPEFSFLDLTDEMPAIIDHWAKLGIEFDAIYTGYLARPDRLRSSAPSSSAFASPKRLWSSTRCSATTASSTAR